MTGTDRVFGMGDEPETDSVWPALSDDEIARAVELTWSAAPATVLWRSPRPLSTTVGVRLTDGSDVVVKRLPVAVRDLAALAEEHRFARHLRAAGIPVPLARAVRASLPGPARAGDARSGASTAADVRTHAPSAVGTVRDSDDGVGARDSADRSVVRGHADGLAMSGSVRWAGMPGPVGTAGVRGAADAAVVGGSAEWVPGSVGAAGVRGSADGVVVGGSAGGDPADSAVMGSGRWAREFVYEVQRVGDGEDRYRSDFSWSPYRDIGDAAGAGAALAGLHTAAVGFDAPVRKARPLVASLHCGDAVGEFGWHLARRPRVAAFLAGRNWYGELPGDRVELAELPPLWTHGDWHPTNLLWRGHEVSTVFDLGLADRTTAVFDLALAVERSAVDWLSIRAGGAAEVRYDQLAAFFEGYLATRSLTPAERRALPALLPLAHIGYELSEIDYFLTVVHDTRDAEIACHDWLFGHLRWYATAEGRELREFVRDLVAC